jgi:Protein of unknown function (DUF2281)
MTILDQINEKLKNVPPAIAQEVLDFVEFLEAKHRPKASDKRIEDFVGVLRDSPVFEDDAVEIQRKMRAEWDR